MAGGFVMYTQGTVVKAPANIAGASISLNDSLSFLYLLLGLIF